MRTVTDAERRSRLARRHGLAPAAHFADPVAATTALTALHATEAASVHLALWARVEGLTAAQVDRALDDDRSLVKQLAMRRTMWVLPRDLLAPVLGSAAARVAAAERRRLVKDVEQAGVAADGERWFARARRATLAHLEDHPEPRSVPQLRAEVPALGQQVTRGSGRWQASVWLATPVTTVLGAQGDVVRGPNGGPGDDRWWLPRPTWTTADRWLGERPEPWSAEQGYAELVRRWLRTFGPGTEDDLVWWLGSTRGAVRQALGSVEAVEVRLEDGASGWLLPDDLEPEPPVDPWAALLPTLDPTTMGWKGRDFHLAPGIRPWIYDSAGNGATTAWWDGRAVGCWVQDDAGTVEVVLHGDVGREAAGLLEQEAARLTEWLGGIRITNAYTARQRRAASLP